jgi:hypothetical protein
MTIFQFLLLLILSAIALTLFGIYTVLKGLLDKVRIKYEEEEDENWWKKGKSNPIDSYLDDDEEYPDDDDDVDDVEDWESTRKG